MLVWAIPWQHNVLSSGSGRLHGSGALQSKGIIVLCCISPTSLGFVVQACRNLFAQLDTCGSQRDSSIHNVLLTCLVALVRCLLDLNPVPGHSCQKRTFLSVLAASAEAKD